MNNDKLHEYINAIETELRRKTGELITYAGAPYNAHIRTARIDLIRRLTEDYVTYNERYPDGALLERLADAVLNEELTDQTSSKAVNTEYPFLSERQLTTRRNTEVGIEAATTRAADGRDYRVPTRRKRNAYENEFVDKVAKGRNASRRKQYFRDKMPSRVSTEPSEPFVEARKQAARWRDELSITY